MEIILIRHGEPDYTNDTLTPRGHKEAKKLAKFLSKIPISAIYQSPNGRARHTCEYTAKKKGIEPITLEWLREVGIKRGDLYLWNAPGTLFLSDSKLPNYEECLEPFGSMPEGKEQFEKVSKGFDEIMSSYGYIKSGHLYRVEKSNVKTIAFFCHHGVIVTLLSYLLHWALPLIFVHSTISPTGMTVLVMEETGRYAQPKMIRFNSLVHLGR
ncbi:MAG: histidine phosphatase family protein [bacterium]